MISEKREVDKDGYLILRKEFKQNSFILKQIYRDGNYAIYHKTKPNTSINHFEAIKILKEEEREMGGIKIEAHEIYPSALHFGNTAFACMTYENALARIKKMKEEDKDENPPSI